MNLKRFALGGFKHVNDDELLVRSLTVTQAMEGNLAFPDPIPDLAVVRSYMQDFSHKLALSRRKGSPQDTAAKNQSRQVLAGAMKELAFYVTTKANGDLQVLLSSGFELSGYPRSGDTPEVVRDVRLSDGKQSGQIRLDFSRQNGVLLYEYRYAQEPVAGEEPVWQPLLRTTASRNNILAPVEPFKRYQVQVRAVNGYGVSEWSEMVSIVSR